VIVRLPTIFVYATLLALLCALSGCSAAAPAPTSLRSLPRHPVVVAIGDSIMKGHGLTPAEAWPSLLAVDDRWKLTNLACDGAGFLRAGNTDDCGNDYSGLVAEAVAKHPQLILISGSSNDLGLDDAQLKRQTDAVVSSLRKKLPNTVIVGISTVWNDTATPDQMNDINEQVKSAIAGAHGLYLNIGQPLAGHKEWLQDDDVHPTVEGQRRLALSISAALKKAEKA
jgi:acyl-CoA thioesterase-1